MKKNLLLIATFLFSISVMAEKADNEPIEITKAFE